MSAFIYLEPNQLLKMGYKCQEGETNSFWLSCSENMFKISDTYRSEWWEGKIYVPCDMTSEVPVTGGKL